MHVDVRGPDDAPGPTVVLDAGLGSFSANWHWVHAELATTLRVVAYDRAGLGSSERGAGPRDARTLAAELRAALQAAGICGPFVLAGHSFGWLPVRAFADLYREETAGLVAVDGSHPDQWRRWPVPHADRILRIADRVTAVLARFGLLRVVDLSAPVSAGLPQRQRDVLRARTARPLTSAVEADQLAGWATSLPFRPLVDLPVVVLGVSEQPFGGETLTALSEELVEGAVRRVVDGATHESLVSRREHAAEVVAAIRTVVTAVAAPASPTGTPRAGRPAQPR